MKLAYTAAAPDGEIRTGAPYAVTLALTVTLALAACATAISIVMLLVHSPSSGLSSVTGLISRQQQSAKSGLYLAAFALILPGSLWIGVRVANALAASAGRSCAASLSGLLVAVFAALIVVVRLSAELQWGDGLRTLLAASVLWLVVATLVLRAVIRDPSRLETLLAGRERAAAWLGVVATFGAILCVTPVRSLSLPGLLTGAIAAAALIALAARRIDLRGPAAAAVDIAAVLVVLVAIPNVIVFTTTGSLPNVYSPPGLIQFQQNWILGPVNQVLGGGTLLVNSPASQYGVGLVYFLAGWFRLVRIGYGTFGLLDGILTAAFYASGYCILRVVGVRRPLAASALALAILTLVYNRTFPVGQLPEQGPLRFGMPILLILLTLIAARGLRAGRAARVGAFLLLAITAIWALEAFAYTLATFLALVAMEAVLRGEQHDRRRWISRQLWLAVAAIVGAHTVFAAATLVAAGRLPDWAPYLAYLNSLLGGAAAVSYGFARWSPVLAVGAACLASAAGVVLLVWRAPTVARERPLKTLALGGMTAYAVALFSYSDNRSSTYLVAYVALPILLAGALWLSLLLELPRAAAVRRVKLAALGSAAALAALMLSAAWPAIASRGSDSLLAHLYPGGGLGAAVDRLIDPPPIDPRAPDGQRLLARYAPAGKVVIVLPDAPELSTEILLRSRRANRLFVGDPAQDSLVPSLWMAKLARQGSQLPAGTPLLVDRAALQLSAALRAKPAIDPVTHPLRGGYPQAELILRAIGQRFRLVVVARGGSGLLIARLAPAAA